MPSSPGARYRRTRATFGSFSHGSLVDELAFDNIKRLASLLPYIAVTILEPALVYTVPLSQIARPIIPNATYTVHSELDGSLLETTVAKIDYRLPATYTLTSTANNRSVDRVTITHEEIDHGFMLIPDAIYGDAKLYTRRTTVQQTGWGHEWEFNFREVYYYPLENDLDQYMYFTGNPRYEIEVMTNDWVDDQIVLDVLRCNLNAIYRPVSESVPAFVRKI